MKWITISKSEWSKLLNELGDNRAVFATCTDPEGTDFGTPYIMTEWGPKDSEEPTLRAENKKVEVWDEWEYFYFKAI